jgi:ParB family chromosome partitioning protein
MKTVPIDSLVFSDDINCRATDRMVGIETLAASIAAHGLISSIQVRPKDGKWEVVDGNRRATAIKLLRERGQWHAQVDVIDLGDITDSDARELSLAANIVREDIHPIDEYEAFARLATTMKMDEIAAHFGRTEKEVRKSLALGQLHPEIRAAWRAGEIPDESARAFTLCKDQDAQADLFKRLKSDGGPILANHIRSALGMDWDARKALAVVGVEHYRAAGGAIVEDLFSGDHIVSDPALAKRLLAEKLQGVCDELVKDGWGFAKIRSEVKNHWTWPRIKPTGKREPTAEEQAAIDDLRRQIEPLTAGNVMGDQLTEEQEEQLASLNDRLEQIEEIIEVRRWGARQKKKAGCFVSVNDENIVIDYGFTDPSEKKAADKQKAPGQEATPSEVPQGPKISVALNLALSEQLTKAAAHVLACDPQLALNLAVAAMECPIWAAPAKIKTDGAPCVADYQPEEDATFNQCFRAICSESKEIVENRLAAAVARSLDLRNHAGGAQGGAAIALLRALDQAALKAASLAHFDAEHYFSGIKAELCHAALDEMGIDKKGRPEKKRDLAELCIKAAKENSWLPPQMRVPQESEEEKPGEREP